MSSGMDPAERAGTRGACSHKCNLMEVPYRRWTRQEDAQLVGNRKAGVPWRQIAKLLGRSRQDCKTRLAQLKDADEVPTVRISEHEDAVGHRPPKPPMTDDSADKGRLGTIRDDKHDKGHVDHVGDLGDLGDLRNPGGVVHDCNSKAGSAWPEYFAWQLAWVWFVQHMHWCRFPKVNRGSSSKMMGWGPGGTQTMKHIEDQYRANVLARIRLEQACAAEPREAKLGGMEATTQEVADRIRAVLDEADFAAPNKGRYQKLAAIIGCEQATARKYCLGLSRIDHERAVILCEHFKVHFDWVAFGKGPKHINSNSEEAVDVSDIPDLRSVHLKHFKGNDMDTVKAEIEAIEKLIEGRDVHNVHVWISTLRLIAKLLEVRAPQSSTTLMEIADYFDGPTAA